MKERAVGVRDLKANLSACLRHVKAGETILIRERGKPIGRILPVEVTLEDKLHEGVRLRRLEIRHQNVQPVPLSC